MCNMFLADSQTTTHITLLIVLQAVCITSIVISVDELITLSQVFGSR